MAAIEPSLAVADAGPIIHLDELRALDLLGDIGRVLVPREVWGEVLQHRSHLAAESLGFRVHGNIGILIRGIRRGLRSRDEALDILRRISQASTLNISRKLLAKVVEAVGGE